MRVFIATPTYSGSLCLEYVNSIIPATATLWRDGHEYQHRLMAGNCYIALARNHLVSEFMESNADAIVFIDDDMGFPSDGISKLIATGKDIVGGVYPMKSNEENYPVRCFTNEDGTPEVENGLIHCGGLPTGFLLIRRNVIEAMMKAYPEREFFDAKTEKKHFDLFACERADGAWWGEDYRFCNLAREAGFKCWCLPDLNFTHRGQFVWGGNYHEYMLRQP